MHNIYEKMYFYQTFRRWHHSGIPVREASDLAWEQLEEARVVVRNEARRVQFENQERMEAERERRAEWYSRIALCAAILALGLLLSVV